MHYPITNQSLREASIEDLEHEIRRHNQLYWDQNAPEISDYDYDRLIEELRRRQPDAAVLQEMGPALVARFGAEVRHRTPMLSLDKCYDPETLVSWAAKFEGAVIAMPKMDGIAASLRYDEQGWLALAATRGNGRVGDDITANAHTLGDIPRKVDAANIEVRGEIYMRLSVFKRFDDKFSNPRNLTAGAIKSKDPQRCRDYQLSFLPYDLLNSDAESEQAKHRLLLSLGFPALDYKLVTKDSLQTGYEYFAKMREDLDYEIDGVVFKADELSEQQRLGSTAHHPRYALAYKFQGDTATTHLKDIEWSVARSGIITPVAHVEPIVLSGATVSRASLHHAGFIAKLGLTHNSELLVSRRGGVIPKVELVTQQGDDPIDLPTSCPSCGGGVVRRGDFLTCANPQQCRAAVVGAIGYFCRVAEIDGFGDKLLSAAYDQGLLRDPADLYTLTSEQLQRLDRVGPKLAEKLVAQIDQRRELELAVFLRALGIEELGTHVSALLAREYETLDRILQLKQEELATLHTIGATIAEKVVRGLRDNSLIDRLRQHISIKPAVDDDASTRNSGPLAGQSFVFTGTLEHFKRADAQQQVIDLGGTTPSGVSQNLDYLVVGTEGHKGSKLKKAEKLVAGGAALRIIGEEQFVEILQKAGVQR